MQRDRNGRSKFKLLAKAEDMALYGYKAVQHMPKRERHVASQELRNGIWAIIELVIAVNDAENKLTPLKRLDRELKKMLIKIRFCEKARLLATTKYENWSAKLVEMGRMTGGMIAAAKKRQQYAVR